MPTEPSAEPQNQADRPSQEDQPIPAASEDKVIEETARLASEGRRELERDPKEPKPQD